MPELTEPSIRTQDTYEAQKRTVEVMQKIIREGKDSAVDMWLESAKNKVVGNIYYTTTNHEGKSMDVSYGNDVYKISRSLIEKGKIKSLEKFLLDDRVFNKLGDDNLKTISLFLDSYPETKAKLAERQAKKIMTELKENIGDVINTEKRPLTKAEKTTTDLKENIKDVGGVDKELNFIANKLKIEDDININAKKDGLEEVKKISTDEKENIRAVVNSINDELNKNKRKAMVFPTDIHASLADIALEEEKKNERKGMKLPDGIHAHLTAIAVAEGKEVTGTHSELPSKISEEQAKNRRKGVRLASGIPSHPTSKGGGR